MIDKKGKITKNVIELRVRSSMFNKINLLIN